MNYILFVKASLVTLVFNSGDVDVTTVFCLAPLLAVAVKVCAGQDLVLYEET